MATTAAFALRSSTCSLTGDANEFLISGLGVICIDTKYRPPPELALGLTRGELISFVGAALFFLVRIVGTYVSLFDPYMSITVVLLTTTLEVSFSLLGSCWRLLLATVLLVDYLQIMVLTMKLPETDFVLVIDLAARRNTFDFFTDRVLFSLELLDCSSTFEVLALH